ncbi:MAG: GGDEF domain-containing protein [Coriobacteriales bacterium]|nr:GGDEF domain-containing protein [Coriobacteriales bacterium]
MLKVFSLLGLSMFFLLFDVTMLSTGFFSINSTTYFLCGLAMLAIFLCATFFLPKHPAGVMPCVYVFEITLYAFGIHISMLHADNPAVSAVAFLLVSPLLFYDRPARLCAMNAMVVALFCVLAVRLKNPDVAEIDIWNMVTFGMVSLAMTVSIMIVKMRALAQTRQIEFLSQTDLLTGAKNRNHYESQLSGYLGRCTSNLICVYADVNGLHEMNNERGHQAGDAMLRDTAASMQGYFGQEHTYRVGGDEFVAFEVDGRLERVSREVERMREGLEKKGYNVSFGIAVYEIGTQATPNIYDIVREAENDMFADKEAFYRKQDNDRSSR